MFTDGAARRREWLARIAGARLATVSDLPAGTWHRLGLLKSLVAGDTMTANFMRRASFDFRPVAKLVVTGNARPSLRSTDSGFARRLVLIPVAKPATIDKHLARTLDAELPRIVSWAIAGAVAYIAHGLPPVPRRWQAATDGYLRAEDAIGGWFTERCELDEDAFTPASRLVADYAEQTGRRLSRATPIYEWLNEQDFDNVTRTRMRHNGSKNAVDGIRGVRLYA